MSLILRCQQGFTTVTLMGVLAVGTLLVAGGFAAVGPDTSISRDDQDRKQAYGAAEAGLQWYLSVLAKDNDYYVNCTNVPDPATGQDAPINQLWNGSGADPRVWRSLPTGDAKYTVEFVPSPGYSACVPGDQYSVVDPSGNMRVRVSGRARGETRTLLSTLRRRNFLDFIYFTHFETLNPLAYESSGKRSWAATRCNQFRSQRATQSSSTYGTCTEIQFPSGDKVLGPFHTNDSIMVCGSPIFGRHSRDAIELNEQSPGYIAAPNCSANPTFQGALTYPSGQLELPPSNAEIANLASSTYTFQGRTKIDLEGDTIVVDRQTGSDLTLPMPPNGLIYVTKTSSGTCSSGYTYLQQYTTTNCGDVYVEGEYSSDLTIAAENDVIIDGNLERSSDGLLLGLIANNFVRVYHPVTVNGSGNCTGNATGTLTDPTIQAAILALNHSFVVDNWFCGAPPGTLTVEGAIAQRYRGPVGMGTSSNPTNGYLKNYVYNDRLRYREPPYFLDPVQASWRVARQTEQVPPVE